MRRALATALAVIAVAGPASAATDSTFGIELLPVPGTWQANSDKVCALVQSRGYWVDCPKVYMADHTDPAWDSIARRADAMAVPEGTIVVDSTAFPMGVPAFAGRPVPFPTQIRIVLHEIGHRMQAVPNRPFRSERQAQLLCDRANRELVGVSWLVMKVDSRNIIKDRIDSKRAMKASA